jgi:hypothetical protein
MTDELKALHDAAQAADDAFRAALVAAYGAEHAREMRYFFAHPAHPEVERAAETYRAASDAWLTAYRAALES